MMPLLYIDEEFIKKDITKDIQNVLQAYLKNKSSKSKSTSINSISNRMKPLDVVKVLMGIRSERDSVKQFQNDGEYWAKLHEYDY